LRRGRPYLSLILGAIALTLGGMHTVQHPSGHVAETVFVGILVVSLMVTSLLRIRLQRRTSDERRGGDSSDFEASHE
jgi:uncharacterized membrane protein (DUF2068 family)